MAHHALISLCSYSSNSSIDIAKLPGNLSCYKKVTLLLYQKPITTLSLSAG